MDAPFRKKKHQYAFLCGILIVLASPFLIHPIIDRETAYNAVPLRMGPYHYIAQQIFHEKDPIDLLFLGSSDMHQGFNIEYLRKDWDQKHGRSFNILMLAANWRGFDKLYFFLKDALAQRKIRCVLLSVYGRNLYPHNASKYLYNVYDHHASITSLPLQTRLAFYAESLFGVPKLLYNKFFPPKRLKDDSKNCAIAMNYGAQIVDYGYDPRNDAEAPRNFVEKNDHPPRLEANDVTYIGGVSRVFQTPYPMNDMEMHFYTLIAQLCKTYATKLVLIQMPFPTDDEKVVKLYQWSFDPNIPTIAVPKGLLFPGMAQKDIEDFYNNSTHFNRNGALYFSKALSDLLYNLFEDTLNADQFSRVSLEQEKSP